MSKTWHNYHSQILILDLWSATPKIPLYQFLKTNLKKFKILATLLDPPFWISKILVQIRNWWPQKPLYTNFQKQIQKNVILWSPPWSRHFEFPKSELRFVISDPKHSYVTIIIRIRSPKKCMPQRVKGCVCW